jgi:hypothetical protein
VTFATGQWFSPGPPNSSINKTGRHDITAILSPLRKYKIYPSFQECETGFLKILGTQELKRMATNFAQK